MNTPLAGLAQHLAGPWWMRDLMALALAGAALLMLLPAAHAALRDAEHTLHRSAAAGYVAERPHVSSYALEHPRAVDMTVAVTILVMLASAGRVTWLARAYAIAIATMLLLTIATLVRLRPTTTPRVLFNAPASLSLIGRGRPLVWLAPGAVVALSSVAMLVTGDAPSLVSAALIVAVSLWFAATGQATSADDGVAEDRFDLLFTSDVSPDQIDVRPGNVLVPVRNPHALAHVVGALQTSGDHDVRDDGEAAGCRCQRGPGESQHADTVRAATVLRGHRSCGARRASGACPHRSGSQRR